MTLKSDATHWGSLAKFFHWAIVLLILAEGALGLVMVMLHKGPGAFVYYDFHKSIGITILALAVLRLLWRAFDPHPHAVPTMPTWQALAARAGHALLYVLLFLVPLSGWWFNSVDGLRPMYWFGLFEVPRIAAPDPGLKHLAHECHEFLFWALVAVAAGHAAAALVHHFFDKDATLTRMFPNKGRPPLGIALVLLTAALIVLPPVTQLMNPRGPREPAESAQTGDAPPKAAAAAAEPTPATQARTWTVDAARSTLGFKGTYQKDGFEGRFKRFDATIDYDEANLTGSKFDVSVDLASADTANDERDESLKGDDFFAVKKFPKAHFVTESFAKAADGGVEAKGMLTIRDQSKPVTLKVRFAESGNTATLDVDTTLKRADFGLGNGGDWTDIGADVPVHAHLELNAR
jgi:cytochrome b561/polyisoprenoid-binding protein YceI